MSNKMFVATSVDGLCWIGDTLENAWEQAEEEGYAISDLTFYPVGEKLDVEIRIVTIPKITAKKENKNV